MSIYVVNKKRGGKGEYIGRPSPLGNPFAMKSESDRSMVVAQYTQWLNDKIEKRDKAICAELNRLYKLAKNGDLNIVCWCAPCACHGDVIKGVIESKLDDVYKNYSI